MSEALDAEAKLELSLHVEATLETTGTEKVEGGILTKVTHLNTPGTHSSTNIRATNQED